MVNLISQIFVACFLMITTGLLSEILWRCLFRLVKDNLSQFAGIMLRIVCLLYVFPVEFILINLLKKDGYLQGNHLWQLNFRSTRIMCVFISVISFVYLLIVFYAHVKSKEGKEKVGLGDIPEEDRIAKNEFIIAKQELEIHGPVYLYRNEFAPIAGIRGLIIARVILPLDKYSKEQLKVIYYHELMHYKHHDIFYKYCSTIAGKLLISHKFYIFRHKLLDEFCEYQSDQSAINVLLGRMEIRDYYGCILACSKTSENRTEEKEDFYLNKDRSQLDRRILYIQTCQKTKWTKNVLVFLLTIVFIFVNLLISYIPGYGLSKFCDFIYKETEQVQFVTAQEKFIRVLLNESYKNTYSLMLSPEMVHSETEYILTILTKESWIMKPDVRYILDVKDLKEGEQVAFSGIVIPNTEVCWVGLIYKCSGKLMFVESRAVFDIVVDVPIDGEYEVFVQNKGKEPLNVSLQIAYNDKMAE